MRRMGMGFLAIGLMLAASGGFGNSMSNNSMSMEIINSRSPSNPIFHQGISQRKKKVNKLRLSHNAKLKRRLNK